MDDKESAFMLGRLDGKLDQVIKAQEAQGETISTRLDNIDDRLRKVEISAAKAGAISGSVVSVGIVLIVEGFKAYFVKH